MWELQFKELQVDSSILFQISDRLLVYENWKKLYIFRFNYSPITTSASSHGLSRVSISPYSGLLSKTNSKDDESKYKLSILMLIFLSA
jgi:hypothetical protein